MPVLTHLNNDQNRINKRINKAALRQATVLLPDVPPPGVSEDVTVNYTALMKSLSNILINLQEVYMSRFQLQFEGEADFDYEDDDYENDEASQASQRSKGSQGSVRSKGSQGSVRSQESELSYATIDDIPAISARVVDDIPANPLHNKTPKREPQRREPQRIPQHIRFLSDSESSGSGFLGSGSSIISMIPLPGQAPSREEEILAREDREQNNPFSSLVLNSLTREIINAKFLAEAIPFSQLTKIQKQNIKQIMVRIGKVMGVIRTGISKPIYVNLQSVLKLIQSGLKTEGDAQEYLLRTQEEMPAEQAGEIEALQGAGLKKHRLLSPALYNAHNVNDNFWYSLSKRNR